MSQVSVSVCRFPCKVVMLTLLIRFYFDLKLAKLHARALIINHYKMNIINAVLYVIYSSQSLSKVRALRELIHVPVYAFIHFS
jgi:hypothetical protein